MSPNNEEMLSIEIVGKLEIETNASPFGRLYFGLKVVPHCNPDSIHDSRPIKSFALRLCNPRSHALSTERTILSPFTKEYRVLDALSGIR